MLLGRRTWLMKARRTLDDLAVFDNRVRTKIVARTTSIRGNGRFCRFREGPIDEHALPALIAGPLPNSRANKNVGEGRLELLAAGFSAADICEWTEFA